MTSLQHQQDKPAAHHELTSEFEHEPVPAEHRRSWSSVAAVWFGFPMILTNAVFGGIIVYGLGFVRGLIAIALGSLALSVYVGALSYVAGSTGRNFALVATSTFGRRGYTVACGFLATIVVGWFAFQTGLTGATLHATFGWNQTLVVLIAGLLYIGITYIGIRALAVLGMISAPLFLVLGLVALWLASRTHSLTGITSYHGTHNSTALTIGAAVTITIATFADSGTMTADFTRWSGSGRQAVTAGLTAFPVANFVALLIGGVIVAAGAAVAPATDGGDFLGLLASHGTALSAVAVAFVLINLGSVCTHCLYNGAVGWSHLTGDKMRRLTLILGAVGVIAALAGVWTHFATWLNILGIFVPPIGAVIITDQLLMRRRAAHRPEAALRPTAFAGWAVGAIVAAVVHYQAPAYAEAVAGMLAAAAAYAVAERLRAPARAVAAAAAHAPELGAQPK
ncbi:cytosine permease [Streptomyces sp. NPDC006012]|uniref:cytosine permease n=1 Tax=Streptomyces sp. NPDC006012 TaxID=3364739 RepID=UPI0036AB5849